MSEVSEHVVSSHPVSVGSAVSYSEDFSSGKPSGIIERASEQKDTSSPRKVASEHISEDSVPTEEDVSDVSLSRDSEATKSIGIGFTVETLQLDKEQVIITAETTVPLQPDKGKRDEVNYQNNFYIIQISGVINYLVSRTCYAVKLKFVS